MSTYDEHLAEFRRRSHIISGSTDADQLMGSAPNLSNRRAVQGLIQDHERRSGPEGDPPPGHVQAAEWQVQAAEQRIAHHTRTMQALGIASVMSPPDEIQDGLAQAQAWRDLLHEEVAKLKELLESFREESGTDRRDAILKHVGELRVCTVFDEARQQHRTGYDYQCISLADSQTGEIIMSDFNPRSKHDLARIPKGGIVIIDDEQSPYDGLSLQAYRAVCDTVGQRRRQREKTLIEQNRALPREKQKPEGQLSARKFRGSPWPPAWPSGAVDYHELREDVSAQRKADADDQHKDEVADAAAEDAAARQRPARTKSM